MYRVISLLLFGLLLAGCQCSTDFSLDDVDVDTDHDTGADVLEEEQPPCPEVTWLNPQDGFTWGRADDADGDMDDGFQHDVMIDIMIDNGTAVDLYVNDDIVATTTVNDHGATFNNVDFPSTGSITLEVRIDPECRSTISGTLDLTPSSCSIIEPSVMEWLNLSHDIDPAPGMQVSVIAACDDAVEIELFVDGEPVSTKSVTDGEALWDSIALDDAPPGERCLVARCIDAADNSGYSASRCFGVDSTAPSIRITKPYVIDCNFGPWEVEVEVQDIDAPPAMGWIWAEMIGDDPCAFMPPAAYDFSTDAAGTFSVEISHEDKGEHLCAVIYEDSGNQSPVDSRTLTVDAIAPWCRIVRPNGVIPDPIVEDSDDSLILCSDDEDPDDVICQYTVLVDCEFPGGTVELFRSTSPDPMAAETCRVCTGVEFPTAPDCDPYVPGRATFSRMVLPPTVATPYTLDATHFDSCDNIGSSPDMDVIVDTEPARISIITPTPVCGAEFRSCDDPFLFDVRVHADSSPATLTVYDGEGVETYSETRHETGLFYFQDVELGQGTNSVRICANDGHCPDGCTDDPEDPGDDCIFTVVPVLYIKIFQPIDGTVLAWSDDVDGNDTNGFQIDVYVVSDVAEGVTIRLEIDAVEVATMPYDDAGVTFNAVTLEEGIRSIRACTEDHRGHCCDSITVTVDLS